MALVAAEHGPSSRKRVFHVYLQHGMIGVLVLAGITILRHDEPGRILAELGPGGLWLVAIFFLSSVILSLFKFKLTEEIFVSLAVTTYIAMAPLLGMVISAWIAVVAAAIPRLLGLLQIGPAKSDLRDPAFEWARILALFATYGIPVIAAVGVFERLGGTVPQLTPSLGGAMRICVLALVLVALNNLIVTRVEQALGYSLGTTIKTAIIDTSIYLVTLPYAILTTFAYGTIGWGGVLAASFTWILANMVARSLAQVRVDREQLIQRLTSLTNIGKTISLNFTTDELLERIYLECRGVIDVSLFSIALHDSSTHELSFEFSVENGVQEPKQRIPITEGLNAWVFTNARPLLIGSNQDERKLGIVSYDDGLRTESWLGVPMIARDHVIGVISVQSFERHAFSQDDLVLLTAIANQAAAAIENAHLYRDLEGLNVALEQRVHERTNELREANLQLISADRSKNQFLASMSHELRTPLNAIIGFSSVLLDVTRTLLPPRLYKMVENIRTAGGHLLDLINDILDLAKIETGKLQLEVQTFDVREMTATVDRVIRGVAAERDVTVVTTIDPSITTAVLDEVRVKQILLNLLSNAVKFSNPGSTVQLTVREIAAADSPLQCDSIELVVQDAGIGIATAEVERIFDRFYQVPGSTQKGGTGLGLSLTHNFVEMHGGSITVESTEGKGSCFTVTLPRTITLAAPRLHASKEPARANLLAP
jgi:signal transduction histidine kinase